MGRPRARRRTPKSDTRRMKAAAACRRHLRDLKRAHGRPPPDIEIEPSFRPQFFSPAPLNSYCTSPASLCEAFAGEFAK
jgi:hypothetical protein